MNHLLFSLSHRMGESWGEGPLRFMVTTRVKNLRFSFTMNRLLFSLSHRMGEGWGEGGLSVQEFKARNPVWGSSLPTPIYG